MPDRTHLEFLKRLHNGAQSNIHYRTGIITVLQRQSKGLYYYDVDSLLHFPRLCVRTPSPEYDGTNTFTTNLE